MASKPMQQSLKYLRDHGWQCAVVERWIQFGPEGQSKMGMPGIRVDVWGFGDILACRYFNELPVPTKETALFQTTDMSSLSKHRTKAENIAELKRWKECGNLAFLHAWAKRGPRGKRKVWTLTEVRL